MKNINAFVVGIRAAGDAWALQAASGFAARPAYAAETAHATAAAAQRKRRTASTAFVDGGII